MHGQSTIMPMYTYVCALHVSNIFKNIREFECNFGFSGKSNSNIKINDLKIKYIKKNPFNLQCHLILNDSLTTQIEIVLLF